MLFLLCFLLFIGFFITSVIRVLFAWLRIKKSTSPSPQPERQRKKFDATDAEDVEFEEIKDQSNQ